MFCLAAFKPSIAATSACARFGLAFASNSSMRAFAARICAAILSS
jgi:hypothetical protein